MAKTPDIHWAEGMFLRPEHFQVFSRRVGSLVAEAVRHCQEFFWGISRIEIAEDQLEAFTFTLNRFDAHLPDGTQLSLPTNLRVNPREFKDQLDQSPGGLPVYLGVPVLRQGEANAEGPEGGGEELRYGVEAMDVADENRGGATRQLEIRKYNGRLLFGDEDRSGFETLPIARVQRSGRAGNLPVLDPSFIPPVNDVQAWPALAAIADSLIHRVEAKSRFLRSEVADGRVALDGAGMSAWQPVFKLQIVGSFLHVLRQLGSVPGVHPFTLYLELSRMAGELAIFEGGGAESLNIPVYDHEQLGRCYNALSYTLERLLEQILAGAFVRVDFAAEGELLMARLQDDWLQPQSEVYLCVESELDDGEIEGLIETAKIGASADLDTLRQRRLFGLDIGRLLKTTPAGLPGQENLHYYAVAKEGGYWESVVKNGEIAIWGAMDPRLRFCVYIVTQPERRKSTGG